VVVGTIGGRARADYTVIGSTVNLAARLQGFSRGEVVVCSETARRLESAVEFDGGKSVAVKGFDRPIIVHRVVALRRGV
jgi:adenylate cyclase